MKNCIQLATFVLFECGVVTESGCVINDIKVLEDMVERFLVSQPQFIIKDDDRYDDNYTR